MTPIQQHNTEKITTTTSLIK